MSLTTLCVLDYNLPPVPEAVRVVKDFGPTTIVTNGTDLKEPFVTGSHMMITGEEHAIKDWFREAGQVWVGKGSPMLEQFELWEFN